MNTTKTIKHWSHHMHDAMLSVWSHVDQHLHSRHFWAGVSIALLIVVFATLIVMLAMNSTIEPFNTYPYGSPYSPYQ